MAATGFWDGVAQAVAHCQTCIDHGEVFMPGEPGAPDELRACPDCTTDIHPVRPPVGATIVVAFGGQGHEIRGTVTAVDDDSIDIVHIAERSDVDGWVWSTDLAGDLFTIWDSEQTTGVAAVRIVEVDR